MAKYINTFANETAIQNALKDGSLNKPYIAYNQNTSTVDYNSKSVDYSLEYLTLEITSAGTINVPTGTTYSIDGGEWENTGTTLTVNGGETIKFKGNNRDYYNSSFSGSTAGFNVEGNIMSMIYGDNFIGQTSFSGSTYIFRSFFQNCTGLTSAENLILPATTLVQSCYIFMFQDCTSLVNAPKLPATELENYCYSAMFRHCTNLVTAPDLPATILARNCYYRMFYDCFKLNYIKCLATDISATDCLHQWVDYVGSSGTFVKKAGVSWPIGGSGIPSGWTVVEV